MSKNNYNLKDLLEDACEEYDEIICNDDDGDVCDEDVIFEIADNAIPIYYWDIAQYAAHNTWLMLEKPEINSDGNAHDQIQANIYGYITEGLMEYIETK